MKTMNYSIIRCICALVLGVLLVAWPEAAILYLVITIGALFLVPGLFSVFGYLTRGKQNGMSFPIAGLGSLLFWSLADDYAGIFCRYSDVCVGSCSCVGRYQPDCKPVCCP